MTGQATIDWRHLALHDPAIAVAVMHEAPVAVPQGSMTEIRDCETNPRLDGGALDFAMSSTDSPGTSRRRAADDPDMLSMCGVH